MADKSGAEGKNLQTTGFFKRTEQIPQIGYAPEIARAAFLLTEDAPLAPEVLSANNVHYVIRLHARREPASEGFETQKDEIAQGLLQQKRQKAFQQWLANAKARSEIKIEKGFIE
jgi:parvulin-like peptidyl-prolyl isomerase